MEISTSRALASMGRCNAACYITAPAFGDRKVGARVVHIGRLMGRNTSKRETRVRRRIATSWTSWPISMASIRLSSSACVCVEWRIDGRVVFSGAAGSVEWTLARGVHRVTARDASGQAAEANIPVKQRSERALPPGDVRMFASGACRAGPRGLLD
jgi:hypothetical protein